jgi:branched-chain amino acid transport system substrate-binding protein
VKLIYYDEKSSASEIPPIYTKLLDVDKLSLLARMVPRWRAYNVDNHPKKEDGYLLAVNSEFNYPNYFVMIPSGPDPKPAFTRGFFNAVLSQNRKPQPVAIVVADQEFSRNAADGARENILQGGLKLGYERTYRPRRRTLLLSRATPISWSPARIRPIRSAWCARWTSSAFKPKAIGGAMVGLQSTAIKAQLSPLLNGFINYEFWRPVPKMQFPGVADLISRKSRPVRILHSSLGVCSASGIATGRGGIKTLDDAKLAGYLREHVFTTVVVDVKFGAKKRMDAIVGSSGPISEHKGIRHRSIQGLVPQVVTPAEYASGEIIYPYERAK